MKPGLGSGVWRCGNLGVCFRVWGLTCLVCFTCFCVFFVRFPSPCIHSRTEKSSFSSGWRFFLFFFCFHTCFCVFFVHFPSPCIHSRTEKSSFSSGRRIFFVFFSRSISWQRGILSRPGNGLVLTFFFLFFLFYLLAEKNSFASGRRMCSLTGKDR